VNEPGLKRALLAAREARQRDLEDWRARRPGQVLLSAGLNLPGARKLRPGSAHLLAGAVRELGAAVPLEPLASGRDLLGPWHLAAVHAPAVEAKRAAMAVETAQPCGRLLDLDLYAAGGRQVGRAELGAPPRTCLVCPDPAGVCAALGRHSADQVLERVDALLLGQWPESPALDPETLAAALVLGARRELDLTPKPGLVDRRDSGAHPDLSHAAMTLSVDLLEQYYDDLLRSARAGRPLDDAVRAGREAEQRMVRAIGGNAHRGYIFLSGLALLAACRCAGHVLALPGTLADLAHAFFRQAPPSAADAMPGAQVRARHGLGGIRQEAERGLPAVFEQGWPAYRESLESGWDPERAGFHLMALLMQQVEDTTAVRRCGPPGLARLRRDGERLQDLLETGRQPRAWLAGMNRAYSRWGLTMGGVADCLALVFALQAAADVP
jgi:triphosphoribosyl-dephospho-CoA synthase